MNNLHIVAQIPGKNPDQAMGKAPPPAIAIAAYKKILLLHETMPTVKYC
ncbi:MULTISPECIES: hypothetical protein [unclassified Nodularia (in: cyanobacteria)]|nr:MULTISPECIES: hypothetical protein [unclassified Nodularia (in: cyanobacteria)]MBE9198111.1 hypothetical protein [Nodularia sp. LEGE 06071]MCC2693198.1 hypothetical protein [Nodularia sp. LEGE 04288]